VVRFRFLWSSMQSGLDVVIVSIIGVKFGSAVGV
jgi:hypothetical protein